MAYLDAILRQDIAFFDKLGAGEVTVRITADMDLIEDGISQKVGITISGVGAFIAAEVIAFVMAWRLALVMLCLPFVVTTWMITIGGRMKQAEAGAMDAYASSSTLVEEALSSMRSVIAHGTQRRLAAKYTKSLAAATRLDFVAKALVSTLVGGMMWFMLMAFALCSWAGSRFAANGDANVSQIVTVLLASAIASVSFGTVAPNLQAFGAAGAAANRIFGVLERKVAAPLDSGVRPDPVGIQGKIVFDSVRLVYPSRRNQMVLEDFTLEIPAGKTTAIVGASGSGKSSLFSLLERLYPPLRGTVSLDGHDIQDLNLRWLRSQVRIVAQDSFLFNTTVFENIGYGLVGTDQESADAATKAKLIGQAARTASAHEFVSELPSGYHTCVGEGGSLLSGGQRQRIAIARAIVSNPRILLLDEATASLDTKSERAIQHALEAASAGRTTVVIAHRLSTVRRADKIVALQHGRIVEQGTHEELLHKEGLYASFVSSQDLKRAEDSDTDDGDLGIQPTTDHPSLTKEKSHRSNLLHQPTPVSLTTPTSFSTNPPTSFTHLLKFLYSLNPPTNPSLILLPLTGSLLSGLAYPVTAILYGNLILALADPALALGGHAVPFWAGMQFLVACVVFMGYLLQGIPLAYASARLVASARSRGFGAVLRQDLAFFNGGEGGGRSPGELTAFLAVGARKLNGLGGVILGSVVNSAVAVAAGFAVAVGFGWKLGLVAASTMPVTLVAGYARYRLLADMEKGGMRGGKGAAAGVVAEAVRGIRTVATLGVGHIVRERYQSRLQEEVRSSLLRDLGLSVLYAFSQSVIFFSSALIFWYGGTHLIVTGEYTVRDFLICFVATTYSAQSAGGIFAFSPDLAGAREAADQLKKLVETVPAIDVESTEGDKPGGIAGDVELSQVSFAYPNTSRAQGHSGPVLDGASFKAAPGSFVALVGASGSGKTTALGMLERFYDPSSGRVLADGVDIRQYHLQQYRSQFALVDQDVVLYSGKIRDNLVTDSDVDESSMEQACREANIWDFVVCYLLSRKRLPMLIKFKHSLPDGLDTVVGPRGAQVSGGQKQRLGIARALLRRPKIL